LPPREIEGRAFARAGILGNPSDGYFGRALSVVVRDFRAVVSLQESDKVTIESPPHDENRFESLSDLSDTVTTRGYYGGARLIKATAKVFHEYCLTHGLGPSGMGFTARYGSSIPRQVGLAGSSAIVTATLRALMVYYEVDIPRDEQPNLVLSAEVDELGITAGLQDRVAQVFEGLLYMDFARERMEELGRGVYEVLDSALLPRMFIAYREEAAKVSGRVLDAVRARWERGDPEILEVMTRLGELATLGRNALVQGKQDRLLAFMDQNFDLRRRIMQVAPGDVAVVEAARDLGASAKLAGSGGAVIGLLPESRNTNQLRERLNALGARFIEPTFA
jgi:glucuronokinase